MLYIESKNHESDIERSSERTILRIQESKQNQSTVQPSNTKGTWARIIHIYIIIFYI